MIQSPLRSKAAQSVSVCGKLLRSGQSVVVSTSAVGPRERTMETKGKISIRNAGKDKLQIVCTL